MSKQDDLARILETGLVAIVRASRGELLADVAEALLAGGVDVIEITFTVPRAERVVEEVARRLGDHVLLGAGTVLDPETARLALAAGAQFLVAPNVNPRVIQLAKRYEKLVFPGAFTPTEILTAWEAGADVVKVFPCDSVGPAYIKALRGPFPQIRLMPTGGVTLETAAAFLRAGACALGVGGSLVEAAAVSEGNLPRIESLARQFVQVIRATKAELKLAP
jgi:2-dehydro-3-deoxyphosphogluconate aldolase/(4S)-4-hydroxy-2-oxoglutarate aldolase